MKKAILWIAGAVVAAGAAFLAYAHHPSIAPIDPGQRPTFDKTTVEKGRLVAAAGFCAECHTQPGKARFSGGYPLDTGFGVIYGTNITPDLETGIGRWSEAAFLRAMRKGVDREGRHLFPAFPYDHFTKMTDEDIRAVYAYLMNDVAPIKNANVETTIPFPMNLRFLQAGWKMLFVSFGPYQPDASKSAQWNRGAYLVEGASHCGACHTPRNLLGAEEKNRAYEGAVIDRWVAPALTASNASAVPWNARELADYLKSGVGRYHGVSAGPMGPVVHDGLRKLPADDLDAIGVYLADTFKASDADPAKNPAVLASLERAKPDKRYRREAGERLYATACAACHYNAKEILPARPDLAINSATRIASPDNLIQVILNGVNNADGVSGVVMPAYRDALGDKEVAAIANYLRSQRAQLTPWAGLDQKVADIRRATAPNH